MKLKFEPRIKSSEINPLIYGFTYLTYDKRIKNRKWFKKKESLFNKRYWQNWSKMQKNEIEPLFFTSNY